jgi:hypothetical protein
MKSVASVLLIVISILSCSDEKDTTYDIYVNATIAETSASQNFEYSLTVIAKDAPLGNVQWTKTFLISDQAQIYIPPTYNHYTFIAQQEGYLAHTQYFLYQDLFLGGSHNYEPRPRLDFEFIPASLNGFIKETWQIKVADGSFKTATIYRPDDQNRCKLYGRLDLPEYFSKIDAIGIGRIALTTVAGAEVSELKLADESRRYLNKVNLFGNDPYLQAKDFCTTIDLTKYPSVTTPEHALFNCDIWFVASADPSYFVKYFIYEPI